MTFCEWPDLLDMKRADRVRGAAVRLGMYLPPYIRHTFYEDGKLIHVEPISPAKERCPLCWGADPESKGPW